LIAVSQQLGHARVDITAQVYAHLLDDSQLDAFASAHEREMLGTVLGEQRARHRKRSTKPMWATRVPKSHPGGRRFESGELH
jgi:hypothetical protein